MLRLKFPSISSARQRAPLPRQRGVRGIFPRMCSSGPCFVLAASGLLVASCGGGGESRRCRRGDHLRGRPGDLSRLQALCRPSQRCPILSWRRTGRASPRQTSGPAVAPRSAPRRAVRARRQARQAGLGDRVVRRRHIMVTVSDGAHDDLVLGGRHLSHHRHGPLSRDDRHRRDLARPGRSSTRWAWPPSSFPTTRSRANGRELAGQGSVLRFLRQHHAAGAMMAWAWGVSRLIDAIEETPSARSIRPGLASRGARATERER